MISCIVRSLKLFSVSKAECASSTGPALKLHVHDRGGGGGGGGGNRFPV